MNNKIKQNYYIKDDDNISISIVIGEEQAGGFAVFLDEQFILFEKTKIVDFPLDKGLEIKSKTLFITSTVIDINPHTNRTSVTYVLSGGKSRLEITSEVTVENDNAPAYYDAEFKFIDSSI